MSSRQCKYVITSHPIIGENVEANLVNTYYWAFTHADNPVYKHAIFFAVEWTHLCSSMGLSPFREFIFTPHDSLDKLLSDVLTRVVLSPLTPQQRSPQQTDLPLSLSKLAIIQLGWTGTLSRGRSSLRMKLKHPESNGCHAEIKFPNAGPFADEFTGGNITRATFEKFRLDLLAYLHDR